MRSPDADVVVVGAGSAGCALVHRLCRDTRLEVVLVEAGPDYGSAAGAAWPDDLLDPTRIPRSHDWGFVDDHADDAPLAELRARVLGGCSAHNQCAAVWGLPRDYDRWARVVADERWSYRALRPGIASVEDARGGNPSFRGRGGLLPTRDYLHDELGSWQRAFLLAARAAGLGDLADLSAPEPAEGVATFQVNVHRSIRWNAGFAFLDPVRDCGRLRVVADALGDRLLFRGRHAQALVCRTDGRELELRARHYVLAAGVYGSPAILMRSGLGPRDHLHAHRVPVVTDLRGVGANLHDHPGVSVRLEPRAAATAALEEDVAAGRFHQSQAALRASGARIHVLPYHAPDRDGESWTFELLAFAMAPSIRGRVELRSRDPEQPPRIDFGYRRGLGAQDRDTLHEGLALIRRLVATPPLASLVTVPADAQTLLDRNGPRAELLGRHLSGYGHAVGTCRMGPDGDAAAAADSRGLVRATENVSVGDASLIPVIPRANTNLTSMLVGWQVAGTTGDLVVRRLRRHALRR